MEAERTGIASGSLTERDIGEKQKNSHVSSNLNEGERRMEQAERFGAGNRGFGTSGRKKRRRLPASFVYTAFLAK
ncbi:hypothetical protein [Cohnella zeiphila]|uniref:Uncharacterized protein n=1 Tax=Cohnella zeiphila TaxID=2761120 RepID=A0A7X0SIE1_9BACL|nr:hypothetical protein [Cohnella zeiphila]MBB6730558.1 hypothetical protein [Cohnella zeiphila]